MALIGLVGGESNVNSALLVYAVKNSPSLIVDCANIANPHSLFPHIKPEELSSAFVLQAEITYKLRDILKNICSYAKDVDAKIIVVTSFGRLFHYNNEEENAAITKQCWELMKKASLQYKIVVAAAPDDSFAGKYCDRRVSYGSYCLEPKNSI